jgi:hypothetical protein
MKDHVSVPDQPDPDASYDPYDPASRPPRLPYARYPADDRRPAGGAYSSAPPAGDRLPPMLPAPPSGYPPPRPATSPLASPRHPDPYGGAPPAPRASASPTYPRTGPARPSGGAYAPDPSIPLPGAGRPAAAHPGAWTGHAPGAARQPWPGSGGPGPGRPGVDDDEDDEPDHPIRTLGAAVVFAALAYGFQTPFWRDLVGEAGEGRNSVRKGAGLVRLLGEVPPVTLSAVAGAVAVLLVVLAVRDARRRRRTGSRPATPRSRVPIRRPNVLESATGERRNVRRQRHR